jgi:geranylgeranyl diphosphate synthase type II
MAILAGDSLLVYAFELLAKAGNVGSMVTMAQSLGMQGMLGGQVLDIQSEGRTVGLETVDLIHRQKTAALIAGSLVMGAQIAGASEAVVQGLRSFGMKIGLAFQIVDDILDIEQTTESLGKDAKSDLARGKATYPSVIGLDASKAKALSLIQEAIAELRSLPLQPTILEKVAHYVTTRVH